MTTTISPKTEEFRSERADLFNQGQRRCNRCLETLDLDQFGPHQRGANGIHGTCHSCRSQYNTAWVTQRSQDDWLYRAIETGRYRARREGLPVDLFDSEDLRRHWQAIGLPEDRCVYTGELLTDQNRSLEHVQPLSDPASAGHVITNVVPALRTVNTSKGPRYLIDFLADRAEANKKKETN